VTDMKSAVEEYDAIIKAFRSVRALEFEKKYNSEHNIKEKNDHFAELYDKVKEVIDKSKIRLLGEYTDCLIELYNTDADYFYNCGFDDCKQLYSHLYLCDKQKNPKR
jgi:hypothetical protein